MSACQRRAATPPNPGSAGPRLLSQRPVPRDCFCARGQPKPRCVGGCAPSYRGCWQEHLQQLMATLAMCQMILLLPGMLFFMEGISSSTNSATEFHRTKRQCHVSLCFSVFLAFSNKKSWPCLCYSMRQLLCVCRGSSCPNTSGCLLNTAMDGHKPGGPQ